MSTSFGSLIEKGYHVPHILCVLFDLLLKNALKDNCWYPHFTDEGTETGLWG